MLPQLNVFMGLVVFSALRYGVDVMSDLIKNVMEFETRMNLSLKAEISVLLSLIEYQSRGCARCQLRKAEGFNGWVVVCNWSDEE